MRCKNHDISYLYQQLYHFGDFREVIVNYWDVFNILHVLNSHKFDSKQLTDLTVYFNIQSCCYISKAGSIANRYLVSNNKLLRKGVNYGGRPAVAQFRSKDLNSIAVIWNFGLVNSTLFTASRRRLIYRKLLSGHEGRSWSLSKNPKALLTSAY